MASSISLLSKNVSRTFLSAIKTPSALYFCKRMSSHEESVSESETEILTSSNIQQTTEPNSNRTVFQRPLENGMDVGVYKAILVGEVGQNPVQKRLKSGRIVTLFSLGTGGIRNNRKSLDNEDPKEYADRCAVQWHRVCVYPERLGDLTLKNVKPGSILYLEGNLETKVFSDPINGLVRRIREIAIRRDGRLIFLGKKSDGAPPPQDELRGVGYY